MSSMGGRETSYSLGDRIECCSLMSQDHDVLVDKPFALPPASQILAMQLPIKRITLQINFRIAGKPLPENRLGAIYESVY